MKLIMILRIISLISAGSHTCWAMSRVAQYDACMLSHFHIECLETIQIFREFWMVSWIDRKLLIFLKSILDYLSTQLSINKFKKKVKLQINFEKLSNNSLEVLAKVETKGLFNYSLYSVSSWSSFFFLLSFLCHIIVI